MFSLKKTRIYPAFKFQRDIKLDILAIIIGVVGGISGFFFRIAIEFLDELLFGPHGVITFAKLHNAETLAIILIVLIPTSGAFIVGYAIKKAFPLSRGHGIPNVLEAMHSHQPIRPKTPLGKFFLSILTIGSGMSAGSEGPIAQIGAGAGSYLGRRYHCSPSEINILIAAGAGAGIAAVFNAPLGGTLFGLEILLAAISPHTAIPIAIASIVAVILNFAILGNLPSVFTVPAYELESIMEIPFILILGILLGFMAVLWQKTLSFAEKYFENNRFDIPIDTAIGGFIVGILLLLFSLDLRGAGYPIIHEVLEGRFSELTSLVGVSLGIFLMVACFLKIFATAISLGSGVSGGIFAPSLFMGATFGAGYAIILDSFLNLNLNIGLYALLAMAAMFAAAARAPITMIIITVEMSGDLNILPAMMLIVLTSFLVHLLLVEESIYTERIAFKGISSTARTASELMDFVTLDEVMSREVVAILEDTLVNDILDIVMCYKHVGYPVVDKEGNLKGMVTMFDIRRIKAQNLAIEDLKVRDIMTKEKNLIVGYPSMTVREAIDLIHRYVIGRLPIVFKKDDKMKLIGIFTRSDFIQTIESFQGFLETDRKRIKRAIETSVENLMLDVIPGSFHHLSDKVVIISRDVVNEAEEYIKKKKVLNSLSS